MSYLASISGFLEPYGPVVYGVVGLLSLLLFALVYWIYGMAISKVALAGYTKRKTEASGASVLSPVQENRQLNLADFYHPYFRSTENVRFENCDLMGPALVHIDGCNLRDGGMVDCEIVIARPDRGIKGAVAFKFCTFVRCHFYRATFVLSIDQYRNFPDYFRQNVPVISDGRIGDI